MPHRPWTDAEKDLLDRNYPMYTWNTYACPVCGKTSDRGQHLPRFFHFDGSDNTACWDAIARGDVEIPLYPVIWP